MGERRDATESADREQQSSGRHEGRGDDEQGYRRTRVATLHRAAGNQAVQELARRGAIQPRLAVSNPRDPSEHEAERVADAVVAAEESAPVAETAAVLHRSGSGTGDTAVDGDLEREIQSVTSGGQSLPRATREYFESRFDRDFSDVRIHTGERADEAARSIDAEAFTHGTDIVFRNGAYQPGTEAGKRLLGHELTHVVQSSEDGRSVYRLPMSEEDIGRTLLLSRMMQWRIESDAFEHAIEAEIRDIFEIYDFDELEREQFEIAIREGALADFAAQFGDSDQASEISNHRSEMHKLVTVIHAGKVLSELEDLGEGFDYNESLIETLRSDIETIQSNIHAMQTVRKRAMARLFEDRNVADISITTSQLMEYLRSEELERDLERMDSAERTEFLQAHLGVLSVMGSREQAEQTTRETIGTLFRIESQRRLLEVDDQERRTEALQQVLEGEGDSGFQDTFDDVVAVSGTTAKIAKKLNGGLNDIDDNLVNVDEWIAALDGQPGRAAAGARRFLRHLDDSGRLGSFVAVTTVLSMEWPDDIQESIEQSGDLATLASSSPDIARALGFYDEAEDLSSGVARFTDEGLEITSGWVRALDFIGEWMGPAGDFITSIVDTMNAQDQFEEGDVGAGIGSTVSAAGAIAGGLMTVGGIVGGSTAWTGVGAIVGLAAGLSGLAISAAWGEDTWETKLEEMGLVEDTDVAYIPGY
jgi:uncharacterized protein YukE